MIGGLGNLGGVLSTVAVAITLVVLCIGGIRYGNTKNLREELEQERKSKEELRKDRDDARTERDDERRERAEDAHKFERQIAQLRGDVETLRRTVTGETHLVALDGALTDLARHVDELHQAVLAIPGQVARQLREGDRR